MTLVKRINVSYIVEYNICCHIFIFDGTQESTIQQSNCRYGHRCYLFPFTYYMLLVFFPFSAYNQKSLMPTVVLCLPIDFVINIVILSNVSTKSFFMYWSWTFSSLSDHYLSNLNIRLLFCTQRPIAIEQNGNITRFCRTFAAHTPVFYLAQLYD